jgi:hypothetical protein
MRITIMPPASPFPLPERLPRELALVRDYWEGLKRGEADMPFADDLDPSALSSLEGRLLLIEVFESPLRFRVTSLGHDIRVHYGSDLSGKFLDELEMKPPLEYLPAQSSATVESRAPTFYSSTPAGARSRAGYARLLLPMWGNGQVQRIFGAIAPG